MQQLCLNFEAMMPSRKSESPNIGISWFYLYTFWSVYVTFLKWQGCTDKEQIGGCTRVSGRDGVGGRKGNVCLQKGNGMDPHSDGTVLSLHRANSNALVVISHEILQDVTIGGN